MNHEQLLRMGAAACDARDAFYLACDEYGGDWETLVAAALEFRRHMGPLTDSLREGVMQELVALREELRVEKERADAAERALRSPTRPAGDVPARLGAKLGVAVKTATALDGRPGAMEGRATPSDTEETDALGLASNEAVARFCRLTRGQSE